MKRLARSKHLRTNKQTNNKQTKCHKVVIIKKKQENVFQLIYNKPEFEYLGFSKSSVCYILSNKSHIHVSQRGFSTIMTRK